MSDQFEKYKDQKDDGRVKLPKSKYSEVIAMYEQLKSSRKVAEAFGVDKKIILFIVNPEYKKRDEQRQKEQEHWKMYYDKEKHTIGMRKYRAKKRKLKIKLKLERK